MKSFYTQPPTSSNNAKVWLSENTHQSGLRSLRSETAVPSFYLPRSASNAGWRAGPMLESPTSWYIWPRVPSAVLFTCSPSWWSLVGQDPKDLINAQAVTQRLCLRHWSLFLSSAVQFPEELSFDSRWGMSFQSMNQRDLPFYPYPNRYHQSGNCRLCPLFESAATTCPSVVYHEASAWSRTPW